MGNEGERVGTEGERAGTEGERAGTEARPAPPARPGSFQSPARPGAVQSPARPGSIPGSVPSPARFNPLPGPGDRARGCGVTANAASAAVALLLQALSVQNALLAGCSQPGRGHEAALGDSPREFSQRIASFQLAEHWSLRGYPEFRLKLTPSAFQKEMSLTTKQRLAIAKKLSLPQIVQPEDKHETSHQKFLAADPEQSSFQPCPPEVVFQNYTPGEVCEVPLVLRNMDKVPHVLKVTLESSPYFQLVGPNDACRKVPPGLSMTVRILFTPEQNKDYFHQVTCITEREEFIVPIRAIGARAILGFPDQLDFSEQPVKCSAQKVLLVRNVGNRAAHYQLSTQSPFSVIPAMGALGVGDSMQVTVEFHPLKTGEHCASLVVHYDTGEATHTSLHGRAVDVPIRLDRSTVTFDKTFVTLSNRTTVLIHNLSNITARFQLKAADTEGEEEQLKLRQYRRLCEQEKDKLSVLLKEYGVETTRREHFALLIRSIWSEKAKVRGDAMLFQDDIFSLEPKEGEIGPNSSAEISVFFKPQEARVYKQTVYCDISGCEKRLPLVLTGEGLGPQLDFYYKEVDIGEIFVSGNNRFEAALFNSGPIEAPFSLTPPSTAMGSCFTFQPQEGIVAPNALQVIRISFCTTILGVFEEEFSFRVTKAPKPATLTIRGCVIPPTFHFDVPALHFGDVSFGFPRTLQCCLFNTSLVPMTFHLHIPGDGFGEPSINASSLNPASPSWGKESDCLMKPREFNIRPCRGTVRALGSMDIKVTLCSNTAREYKLEMVMDVEGVGQKVFALPLTARCIVPPLRVLDPVVKFDHCCLTVPYEEKLTLVNDSDFPGCYCILPQENKEKAAAWYSSSEPSGIIKAHSSVEIPITLEAQVLGKCDIPAELAVFGRERSPLVIHLECVGQGPVVYVYPRQINFGTIPVVQDSVKTLHLSNQSAIPAIFRAEMAGKRSCWRVEPNKGVVAPNSELLVAVIANLNDTKKFQDSVTVFIENSLTTTISVQAVGIGTTIVTDKPLVPALDLKSHFSFTPCCYKFKMTNKGRQTHQLYWSTEGFHAFRQNTRPPALKGSRSKDASQTPRPGSPVFKLRPLMTDLRPGQTVEMVLEGCSSTVQEVKERLLCHAVVGKTKAKKQIMQVDVTCKFICPSVQMSTKAITFRVEKKPSDILMPQYKPLSLRNTCSLPLSIVLDLKQPFLICNRDQQPLPADSKPMTLDVGEELHLCIQFNPAYKKDLKSWVAEKVLRLRFVGHPREEHITVRGEVYFPNLHLQAEAVDFGCIINDTEQELCMEMSNCSPIPVQYHWSFLTDSQVNTIRFLPSPPEFKPQSSKKEGVFQRRYSKIKSVEEPTETPESTLDSAWEDSAQEDSAQEYSAQEDSAEEDSSEVDSAHESSDQEDSAHENSDQEAPAPEDPAQEDPAQEDRAQEAPAQEDPAQEDPAQEDPAQEPADAEDPLKAEELPSTAVEPQRQVRRRRGLSQFSEMKRLNLGMQEVFDVRPLWGELQPGQSHLVTFSFFGYANIVARVRALCHVEGGPTYEVVLTGQASCPSYQLDVEEIDWGLQVFTKVLQAEVTLRNTGVIEFTYVVPNSSTGTAANPLPGVPVVMPTTGSIAPGEKQVLKVYYLPGKQGVFCKTFQVQVAYLEPAEIFLKGEGTLSGITKDLPRKSSKGKRKKRNLKKEKRKRDESSAIHPEDKP
ncbi:hydrocephalus-inducing protein homolog [Poecile atricapillus]|uniref:hydrocephalus-inducing protein homolog n=1 Tax=Poecile atricapillus TaxID=48891 RepID=UPI002738A3DC|nr:hydrocephalus-inducing protein homolog [Poecile atricapillus]